MHTLSRHAALKQRGFHRIDHRRRAADESGIDIVGRDQRIQKCMGLGAIKPPVEQRNLLRLTRQHVIQREAIEVAVLQVFERLAKNDAVDAAVAVDQREAALRLRRERGLDKRQDGCDAAAGRKGDVVASAFGGERHIEAPIWRQHIKRLAHADTVVQMVGEHTRINTLDCHPQLAVRVVVLYGAANRIRAPQFFVSWQLAGRHAQRQELALRKSVCIAQIVRHIEAHGNRIGRLAAHFGNAQGVKLRSHGRRARWA